MLPCRQSRLPILAHARLILALVMAVLCLNVGSAATQKDKAKRKTLDAWEGRQVKLIKQEFADFKRRIKRKKSFVVSSDLLQAIQNFDREKRKSPGNGDYVYLIPQPIRAAMWNSLRDQVEQENQDALERFIDIEEQFCVESRKEAVECFVVFLDNHLVLSEKQFKACEKVVEKNWDNDWNFNAFLMIFRSNRYGEKPIGSLDVKSFEEILDPIQFKIFKEIEKLGADPNTMYSKAFAGGNFDFDKTKNCVSELMAPLLHDLTKNYGLTEHQSKRLSVARRGAMKALSKRWQLHHKGTVSYKELETTPLMIQLMQQALMQRSVEKALSEENYQRYVAESKRKEKMRARCLLNYLLFFYCDQSKKTRLPTKTRDAIVDRFMVELNKLDYVDFGVVNKIILSKAKDIMPQEMPEKDWNAISNKFNR